MKTFTKVLLATAAVPLFAVAAAVATVAVRPKAEAIEATASAARYACRVFIEQRAKDPSSVEFGDARDWRVKAPASGSTVWQVTAEFRARNGFGAVGLHRVDCVVDFAPTGWRLQKLT